MTILKNALVMCVSSLILASCQKEEAANVVTADGGPELGRTKSGGAGPMNLQWKPDHIGGNHECPPDGNKCLEATFLRPSDEEVLKDIMDLILAGNGSAIVTAFRLNEAVLKNYIHQNHIDDVIAGRAMPSALHNTATNLDFMVFAEASGDEAYQMKFQ